MVCTQQEAKRLSDMYQRLTLSLDALAPAAMSTSSKGDEDKFVVADDGTLFYSDSSSSDSVSDDPVLRNSLRTSFHQGTQGFSASMMTCLFRS